MHSAPRGLRYLSRRSTNLEAMLGCHLMHTLHQVIEVHFSPSRWSWTPVLDSFSVVPNNSARRGHSSIFFFFYICSWNAVIEALYRQILNLKCLPRFELSEAHRTAVFLGIGVMHKWSFSDVGSDRTSLICGHVTGHITGHKRDKHFCQREYTLCLIITEMTDITPPIPF